MLNLINRLDDKSNDQYSTLDFVVIPALAMIENDLSALSLHGMQILSKMETLGAFKRAKALLLKEFYNISLCWHDISRTELDGQSRIRISLFDHQNTIHRFYFDFNGNRILPMK